MFDLATNSEIGIYLEHLIKKKYQQQKEKFLVG